MHEQDKAIVQGLVSVAWADGTFDEKERALLDALIEAFGASETDAAELREYAKERRGLEDIPLNELSFGDRRNLFNHAVALSWVDGDQHADEVAFLEELRKKLNLGEEEAAEIARVASARAKELLEQTR